MTLTSFCGILTLQVGVAVLAAVFFTLAGVILAANIFSYEYVNGGWPLSLIFTIIFVVGLIIAGGLMFSSSYAENRSLAMAAMVVIIILFFYWIVLCCFSFVSAPTHVKTVCVYLHCPESFWIANLAYRTMYHRDTTNYNEDEVDDYESQFKKKRSINNTTYFLNTSNNFNPDTKNNSRNESLYQNYDFDLEDTEESFNKNRIVENLKYNNGNYNMYIHKNGLFHNILNQIFIQHLESTSDTPKPKEHEEKSRYYVGFPLFGAILLFIINFIFLLFTICVMWSWASELNWTEYYIEDEPVVIYEDNY